MLHAMSRYCAGFAAATLLATSGVPAFAAAASELDYVRIARATDGRCIAEVKRAGNLYAVNISGLEPGEHFTVLSTSEREEIHIPGEVAAKGVVIVVIAPHVKGYSSGIAHIDFTSRRCRLHVSYPWRDD